MPEAIGSPPLVHPFFIIVCMVTVSTCILLGSWMHFQVFVPSDEPFSVQPFSTEQAIPADSNPPVITVGLVITRFLTFTIPTNQFTFEGTLWFYCNIREVPLAILNGVTFENGTFVEKSDPQYETDERGSFVRYAIRVKCETQLNYRAFPDDDHRIAIMLLHKGITTGEYIFSATRPDFVIQDQLEREGWTIFDQTTQAGYVESRIVAASGNHTIRHPAVAFGLDIRRTSMKEFITILFPMLIMLIVAMSAFAISGAPERLSLTLSSIAGLVAFRFVMDTISPKVPYFMLSDYLFLLFLIAHVIIFFVNLISNRLSLRGIKIVLVGTSILVTISCTLLWTNF